LSATDHVVSEAFVLIKSIFLDPNFEPPNNDSPNAKIQKKDPPGPFASNPMTISTTAASPQGTVPQPAVLVGSEAEQLISSDILKEFSEAAPKNEKAPP
jgi:hypothetical protein